jgi:energy-coupling factor transport system ATP-binding protein
MTIVMVSQDAEHVVAYADRLALLAEGRIVREGPPAEVLQDTDLLHAIGLAAPQLADLAHTLSAQHGRTYRFTALDEAEAALRADLEGRQ